MGALDPETATTLGYAAVAATLFASLITLISTQIAARVGRGGARQVARIQADAQLEIDRRKALREHRTERLRAFLEHANRRFGAWHELQLAAHRRDHADRHGGAQD